VLVGAGTLQTDDPELTVRHVRGKNPARLLLSTSHGLPGEYKLSGSAGQVRTILLTGEDYRGEIDPHVEVVRFPTTNDGKIDPISILTKLPELGICSLLIEGGSGVISSFMDAGVIDRITVAYCPSVVGKGIGPFDGFTPPDWGDRPKFKIEYVTRSGADVIVRYQPESAKFLQD
jgi:diaminohydroxyphosphoribosylaminopyrimidine deaminase/5-amino-6-(5-phosphoribosylamino)uracil reductase